MSEEEIIKDIDDVFYNLEDMMSESSAVDKRVQWQRFKDLYNKKKKEYLQLQAFYEKDYVRKDRRINKTRRL